MCANCAEWSRQTQRYNNSPPYLTVKMTPTPHSINTGVKKRPDSPLLIPWYKLYIFTNKHLKCVLLLFINVAAPPESELNAVHNLILTPSLKRVKDVTSRLSNEHKEIHSSVSKVGRAVDKASTNFFYFTANELPIFHNLTCFLYKKVQFYSKFPSKYQYFLARSFLNFPLLPYHDPIVHMYVQ